ncbi:MAG: SurA N-terminal domain-containing protein [Candidatus Adiutrix sp.]|jgi:peptidyl-prolyl cis-trans isomerase SurA|nr:SurA N-terminal domain-containing protein [Candidatus Adiutrix sp.]
MRALCLAIILAALAAAPALAADSDGIAAVVNGEVITRKQLENRVDALVRHGRLPAGLGRGDLKEKVLEDLIDQELINQAAKAKGVFITEGDVNEALERIKRQNNLTEAQFRASVAQSGVSLEAFREDVRLELLRGRVMGSGKLLNRIVITDKEVRAYLNGEGPRLETRSGRGLRMIVLPLDPKKPEASLAEAQRIRQEIENGLSFAEAAGKYSRGPGHDQGGDPGDAVSLDQLPPQLREILAALPPGRPTEPINAGKAIVLMTLAGEEPVPAAGADGQFSLEAQENARRLLERQKMQQNFNNWLEDLRRKAVIKRPAA